MDNPSGAVGWAAPPPSIQPPHKPAVADSIERQKNLHAQLVDFENRLRRLSNRVIFGTEEVPENKPQETVRPGRSGLVGIFENISDDISERIGNFNAIVSQLEEHI